MKNREIILKLLKKGLHDYKVTTSSFDFYADMLYTKYGFNNYFYNLVCKEYKNKFNKTEISNEYFEIYNNIINLIDKVLILDEVELFREVLMNNKIYVYSKEINYYEIIILQRLIYNIEKRNFLNENKRIVLNNLKKVLKEYKFYNFFYFLYFFDTFTNIGYGFCLFLERRNPIYHKEILKELEMDKDIYYNYSKYFWYIPCHRSKRGVELRIENIERTIKRLENENFDNFINGLSIL